MAPFPVSASVLSDMHLATYLQQHYFPAQPVTCRLLKTFVNDTYLVQERDHLYIFRIYRYGWRTEKEVAEEIRFITLLTENDIPVSGALADTAGNYIQHLEAPEGIRYGVLFSFAPGEKIYNPPAETHYTIGRQMAQMHRLSTSLQLERIIYTPQVVLVDSFEKFRSYLADDSDEMKYLESLQQNLLQELGKANTSELRQGAIHLDAWPDNMHIDGAGQITIFDFDFCGNGWLAYDIAFYLLMLSSHEPVKENYLEKAVAFLNGYESLQKISAGEKRLLPALGAAINFYYLGAQRELFSTVFFNELHVQRYIQHRIKRWVELNG